MKLVALFSPEHGIRGILDAKVPSETDEKTGLPIHSLYGETRRPTAAMLDGLDAIVIDLQDIGARFYTYMTTMAYVMEEAAKKGIGVTVLDRPNPINGAQIEGPMLDKGAPAFTGYFPMPIRHGMTLGELAKLFNAENKIGADLTVVQMRDGSEACGSTRRACPGSTRRPNMRNLIQATLYPGIGAIEGTNISVGRGTDTPFEQLGAPWIDGVQLADALNARNFAGVRFYPVRFTPVVEQARERGMPGRVHHRHRSRRAAPGPGRARGRRDAAQTVRVEVRAGIRRAPVRIEGRAGAHPQRRGSGSHCRDLGGRRGALAAAEGEVPARTG